MSSALYSETGTVDAHFGLGVPHLGVYGSANLYTWARALDEVQTRFQDGRSVPQGLHDDSADRGTRGTNYATGAGALLHELGHCFGCFTTRKSWAGALTTCIATLCWKRHPRVPGLDPKRDGRPYRPFG